MLPLILTPRGTQTKEARVWLVPCPPLYVLSLDTREPSLSVFPIINRNHERNSEKSCKSFQQTVK